MPSPLCDAFKSGHYPRLLKKALTRFCQNSPQQAVIMAVTSLGVFSYAAANEVRRTRVRAV